MSTVSKLSNTSLLISFLSLLFITSFMINPGPVRALSPAVTELQRSLENIVTQPGVSAAWVGVRVETLDGELLYDYNGSRLFMPASNMKLITGAAGLELLGPDHRWNTRVWVDEWEGADRDMTEGPLPAVIQGDIYLQGGGDPTLMQQDLQRMASSLYNRGVREIRGNLIYDDSFFDSVRWASGWDWDYLDRYYAAPISGLSLSPDTDYDANTIKVSVYPSSTLFEPGLVVLSPSLAQVEVINETRTAGSNATSSISAWWLDDRTLVVSGHTPLGRGASNVWISVKNPSDLVAGVFAGALQRSSITLHGDVIAGRLQGHQVVVEAHESMTLAQLMVPFMKLSNNGHGEVILKTLGQKFRSQGSWSAGIATITMFLRDIVRAPGTFSIVDGSGLARRNLVTPEQLVAVLRYMADRPNYSIFYNSLPVAGAPDRMIGGTLRSRMQGTPAQYNARAKTGTIGNVSALSGYVTSASGERLVFSIMLNHALNVPSTTYQDTIVNLLSRYRSTEQ